MRSTLRTRSKWKVSPSLGTVNFSSDIVAYYSKKKSRLITMSIQIILKDFESYTVLFRRWKHPECNSGDQVNCEDVEDCH